MMEVPMVIKLTEIRQCENGEVKEYALLYAFGVGCIARRANKPSGANSCINGTLYVRETLEEIYSAARPLYCPHMDQPRLNKGWPVVHVEEMILDSGMCHRTVKMVRQNEDNSLTVTIAKED